MKKLDKRQAKQCRGGGFRQKKRVKLLPSSQPVPADAPEWAVRPQYRASTSTPCASTAASTSTDSTTPVGRNTELPHAKRHLQYASEKDIDTNTDSDSDSFVDDCDL